MCFRATISENYIKNSITKILLNFGLIMVALCDFTVVTSKSLKRLSRVICDFQTRAFLSFWQVAFLKKTARKLDADFQEFFTVYIVN